MKFQMSDFKELALEGAARGSPLALLLVVLFNFNIPADHPDIEGCLQNIVGFLERNFGVENQPSITYQVTASYYLRRPDNGDERILDGIVCCRERPKLFSIGPPLCSLRPRELRRCVFAGACPTKTSWTV